MADIGGIWDENIIFVSATAWIETFTNIKNNVMKKLIALAACVVLMAGTAFSQDYRHSIGLRLGGTAGIDYRYNMNSSNAVEAIASFWYDGGFMLTGLYEWKTPVITDGFNLYYGPGLHLGGFKNAFAIGIDGIVGLEYKFNGAPVALSLDYKPTIHFAFGNGGAAFGHNFYDFAFGVKFTF